MCQAVLRPQDTGSFCRPILAGCAVAVWVAVASAETQPSASESPIARTQAKRMVELVFTATQDYRDALQEVTFDVKLDVVKQELSPDFCWFHPRVAAVPGAGRDGRPAVVMTLQKHLGASDHYSGLWMMRTDDLGKTWTGPTEIPELAWT